MIKARVEHADGTPGLLVGLSRGNIDKLLAGQPVVLTPLDLQVIGLPMMSVAIIFGETEQAIAEDLGKAIKQPEPGDVVVTSKPST